MLLQIKLRSVTLLSRKEKINRYCLAIYVCLYLFAWAAISFISGSYPLVLLLLMKFVWFYYIYLSLLGNQLPATYAEIWLFSDYSEKSWNYQFPHLELSSDPLISSLNFVCYLQSSFICSLLLKLGSWNKDPNNHLHQGHSCWTCWFPSEHCQLLRWQMFTRAHQHTESLPTCF